MQNGTMLDERYRFERKLGTALLATHIGTGSRMVIKPRSCFQDPQAVKQLSQLRHPSLPRIIDEISIHKANIEERCLVTEYLEGETFSEWMKSSEGRLLPDQLLPLMAEVARTISFLHEQNEPHMLHLDVKPEHLVRMPDGHAGLIDFDCCRLYPLDPITKSTIRCTIGYAAPELMSGSPGPESDIYALGVTMLVLLTGKNITDGVLPSIGSLHQLIPPAVMTILANCINSDPKMRYSSAAALACALENQVLRKNRISNRIKTNISDVQKNDPVPNMVSVDPAKIDDCPVVRNKKGVFRHKYQMNHRFTAIRTNWS
jgi:serine/threonine protein kinase